MATIRLVSESDLPTLAKIYKEAYNSLNIGENWDDATALLLMKHLYKEQSDLFFVAEENGNMVGGIVALVKPWWDGNHLTDGEVFIASRHQKKGVGTRLIKHLFTEAFKKYKVVSWDTFTHRIYEHPLKWYKGMGFEEIEQWVMITGDIKGVLKKLK